MLSLFYRRGNGATEKLCDFSKATRVGSSRAKMQTHAGRLVSGSVLMASPCSQRLPGTGTWQVLGPGTWQVLKSKR